MAPPPPTRRQLIADSAQTATRPTVHQGEASTLAVSSLDFQHPVDPGSAAKYEPAIPDSGHCGL